MKTTAFEIAQTVGLTGMDLARLGNALCPGGETLMDRLTTRLEIIAEPREEDLSSVVARVMQDIERLDQNAGVAARFGTPRGSIREVRSKDTPPIRWNGDFAADLRRLVAVVAVVAETQELRT
jgi:hypothetical protein